MLPESSVAVQVLSIVPTPSTVLSTSTNAISTDVSALSVAVAEPVLDGSVLSPTWIVTSAGTVMTGSMLSCIVIV